MAAFTINTANVIRSASGQIFIGTAGATITAGQPLYYDSTNSVYKLANAISSTANVVAGIAVASANVNQDIPICTRDPNFSPGYPIVSGNIALLGNTAGGVQPYEDKATGWYVTSLGVGIGQNRVNFILQGSNVTF